MAVGTAAGTVNGPAPDEAPNGIPAMPAPPNIDDVVDDDDDE